MTPALLSYRTALLKWAIRAALALGLAWLLVRAGYAPDWLMPVAWIYAALSLLLSLGLTTWARRKVATRAGGNAP